MKHKFVYILILFLLPAIIPIFKPYVAGTADGIGHRFRLVSFYNSLKEGNIRPRWAGEAALGYGAPTFLFNYPLPYYIASFFHSFGFSINASGQLLSAFSLFFSGVFMYLLGKKLTGGLGGLAAAAVYTYAPYHLQMTYLYDSWGEEVAFIFPPLILYLTASICHSDSLAKPRVEESRSLSAKLLAFARDPSHSLGMTLTCHFFLLVFAWVLFILSHNVSALMFAPIILFMALLLGKFKMKPFFLVLNAFILAVINSSFFWLPAISLQNEMKYPQFLAQEGSMRGSFFKSFSFQWETAFRVIKEGVTHYLDFTIGLPTILIGLISLFYLLLNTHFFGRSKKWVKEIAANGGFLVFLTSRSREETSSTRSGTTPHLCASARKTTKTLQRQIINLFQLDYWVIGLLVVLLMSLYLTTYHSNWIWNLPIISIYLSYILYPFRFLFVTSFAGAILTGLLISHGIHEVSLLAYKIFLFARSQGHGSAEKQVPYATYENFILPRKLLMVFVAVILIGTSLIQGLPYTRPYVDIFPFPDSYFYQSQTVSSAPGTHKNMLLKEFLPVQTHLSFLEKAETDASDKKEIIVIKGDGEVADMKSQAEGIVAQVHIKKDAQILLNRFYFPNWQATINGKSVPIESDTVGRMQLKLPEGEHNLKVIFGISRLEIIANIVSLVGIIILVTEIVFLPWKHLLSSS